MNKLIQRNNIYKICYDEVSRNLVGVRSLLIGN